MHNIYNMYKPVFIVIHNDKMVVILISERCQSLAILLLSLEDNLIILERIQSFIDKETQG